VTEVLAIAVHALLHGARHDLLFDRINKVRIFNEARLKQFVVVLHPHNVYTRSAVSHGGTIA